MVSVFISASLADYRPDKTQDDNLASAAEAVAEARANGLGVIAVVAKAFGCSVEGEVPFDRVLRLARGLHDAGATEICLGDTSGEAGPAQVARRVGDTLDAFPDSPLSLHFHDTRGLGLANVLAAMDAGATRFDSAVGGIGGSPQTPQFHRQHLDRGPPAPVRGRRRRDWGRPGHRARGLPLPRRETGPSAPRSPGEVRPQQEGVRVMTTQPPQDMFAGVKVLDLSRGVAGPLTSMMLAEFGADVVFVEHPRAKDESRSGRRSRKASAPTMPPTTAPSGPSRST